MIVDVGNVSTRVIQSTDAERSWISEYLAFEDNSARYRRANGMKDGRIRLFNGFSCSFPSGFLPLVLRASGEEGIVVQVLDKRTAPCAPDASADVAWLRDYQHAAVAKIEERARGILHMPTGSGKTEVAAALALRFPIPWLFLVHRTNLGDAAAERYERRTMLRAGRIGEGRWDVPEDATFVTATFQTIARGLDKKDPRVLQLLRHARGLLVDECFPAGTLIDGRPIETIRVGDLVRSYDARTSRVVLRPVRKVWVTPARALVRVYVAGQKIVCTGGHPFFTRRGWVPARELLGEDVLQSSHAMPYMPRDFHPDTATALRPETTRLDPCLLQGVSTPAGDERDGARDALVKDDVGQPDVRPKSTSADGEVATRARRLVPAGARREWEGPNSPAETSLRGAARVGPVHGTVLEHRALGSDEDGDAPVQLQDRHRERTLHDRNRGRRGVAQVKEGARDGCAQEPYAHWSRVDRVEVLELRDSREREGVCPDGLVYNLHVEETETYFANDTLVHNCHVLPASSFYRVVCAAENAYWRVGLSGTPLARGDRRSLLAVGALGPVVYRLPTTELVEAGVLAKPTIHMVEVRQQIDLPTFQGVYGAAVVRSRYRNAVVIDCVKRAERPCLVFVKEIAHGRALEKMMWKEGLRPAFVWGSASVDARNRHVRDLVSGRTDVLICSVIFQEGTDIPDLRSVVIASGGKSVIATLQRIGRGMRTAADKSTFEVWDVADRGCGCSGKEKHSGCRWLDQHTRSRTKAYAAEGHVIVQEQPLVLAPS